MEIRLGREYGSDVAGRINAVPIVGPTLGFLVTPMREVLIIFSVGICC